MHGAAGPEVLSGLRCTALPRTAAPRQVANMLTSCFCHCSEDFRRGRATPEPGSGVSVAAMESSFESSLTLLMHLPSDCHVRMLLMCSMGMVRNLYCTCSTWKEIVISASWYEHRIWSIMITMHETIQASLCNLKPMPPILPNVAPCLLHLCPEECVEALYVHTYIWHCSPPDLEWATHEVRRMVRIEVARNPAGILGIRGYFKALQKDCKQMQQQPYAPHEEAPKSSVTGNSFHLPAIQAACAILAEGSNICCCEDERLLLEFAALWSEIFGWVA